MLTRRAGQWLIGTVCLVSTFALAACDSKSAPVAASKPVAATVILGPNSTALAFVEGMKNGKAFELAKITVAPLCDYFQSIGRQGEIHHKLVAAFRGFYPDEADDKKLKDMTSTWQQPMTYMEKLTLDGKLREEAGGQRCVYQITYKNPLKYVVSHEELVVVKDGQGWKVASFGTETPRGPHIGGRKTVFHRLNYTYEAALGVVEKNRPSRLAKGLELFAEASNRLLEKP